jgi:glycine betaine/choline ABC-type transport system substrate-binding protein
MLYGCSSDSGELIIGTKDFTEQHILGYILSLYIEANTDFSTTVIKDFSSEVIFSGLRNSVVDLYVEYTGTIYSNYFSFFFPTTSGDVLRITSNTIADNYGLFMFNPLGFNNSYELAVQRGIAFSYNIRTISDLAAISPDLIMGGGLEFMRRNDGFRNLKIVYDLNFREEVYIDHMDRYRAISEDEIQVTEVFRTDGALLSYDLFVLEDDRNFFPPYQGVIITREEILDNHPQLKSLLEVLSGTITDAVMRNLNYRVDILGEDPRYVAESFLRDNNLIP